VCQKGSCTHEITSGCLINKACLPNGEINVANPCEECIHNKSKTAFTFVSGKPCFSTTGLAAICANKKCSAFIESTFEPLSASSTALVAATSVPNNTNKIWTVGWTKATSTSNPKGVLKQLSSGTSIILPITTPNPLTNIHRDLAVGEKGELRHHDGTSWKTLTYPAAIGAITRADVCGFDMASNPTYYLAGDNSTTTAGIIACTITAGVLSCTPHTGFTTGIGFSSLYCSSSLTTTGPSWAVESNPTGAEDIFYKAATGTAWANTSPQGCEDKGATGTTPCSRAKGSFDHLNGSGDMDVWAVGGGGLILQYDGKAWKKISGAFTSQTSYDITAVYSDPTEQLVIFAAYKAVTSGNDLVLITYNRSLLRWFSPVPIHKAANKNSDDRINDIAANGVTDLWMVGQRTVGIGAARRMKGWTLQLK